MSHFARHFSMPLLAASLVLALLAFAGCGSGGASGDDPAHLEGSSEHISKPTLGHWMESMVGGDFRQALAFKGPAGLASEPADYPRCVAAVKSVKRWTRPGHVNLSDAELEADCRKLHEALKAQALGFLISVQWTIQEGAELGLRATDAQVKREFARFRTEPYPTEADLRTYLDQRHWSLSDVLYQVKRNILVRELYAKQQAKAAADPRAYVALARDRLHRMIAKTDCTSGYVVPYCKQYHGPLTIAPAPALILEALVYGRKL